MLYLLWSCLNLVLAVGLLYFLVRTLLLVRQQRGLGAAVLASLVLATLCHREATPTAGATPRVVAGAPTALGPGAAFVTLEEQPAFRVGLVLHKGRAVGDTAVGLHATPYFSGVVAGQEWAWLPGSYQLQGRRLRYAVPVQLHWKLLGLPLYTQFKYYHGSTVLP